MGAIGPEITRGIEVTHEDDDVLPDGGTRRVPLTLMDGEGSPTAQQLALPPSLKMVLRSMKFYFSTSE
jgi:hypothetical protein